MVRMFLQVHWIGLIPRSSSLSSLVGHKITASKTRSVQVSLQWYFWRLPFDYAMVMFGSQLVLILQIADSVSGMMLLVSEPIVLLLFAVDEQSG